MQLLQRLLVFVPGLKVHVLSDDSLMQPLGENEQKYWKIDNMLDAILYFNALLSYNSTF